MEFDWFSCFYIKPLHCLKLKVPILKKHFFALLSKFYSWNMYVHHVKFLFVNLSQCILILQIHCLHFHPQDAGSVNGTYYRTTVTILLKEILCYPLVQKSANYDSFISLKRCRANRSAFPSLLFETYPPQRFWRIQISSSFWNEHVIWEVLHLRHRKFRNTSCGLPLKFHWSNKIFFLL